MKFGEFRVGEYFCSRLTKADSLEIYTDRDAVIASAELTWKQSSFRRLPDFLADTPRRKRKKERLG